MSTSYPCSFLTVLSIKCRLLRFITASLMQLKWIVCFIFGLFSSYVLNVLSCGHVIPNKGLFGTLMRPRPICGGSLSFLWLSNCIICNSTNTKQLCSHLIIWSECRVESASMSCWFWKYSIGTRISLGKRSMVSTARPSGTSLLLVTKSRRLNV